MAPFNGDSFLHAEVAKLVGHWNVRTAVETGTHVGDTAFALSLLCPHVHSIELDTGAFAAACEKYSEVANLRLHQGSSPEVLKSLFFPDRSLFYLDAHWNDYWPIRDELQSIGKVAVRPPVIVIHDFLVPQHPHLGFDTYNGQSLDLEYVKPGLDFIYGQRYRTRYNKVALGASRGVLFVEPMETL